MKLYDKMKFWLDFNNSYTMRKAMSILESEQNLALSRKDFVYARDVFDTAQELLKDFKDSFRDSEDYGSTISYSQRHWIKQMQALLNIMITRMQDTFNLPSVQDMINETQQTQQLDI